MSAASLARERRNSAGARLETPLPAPEQQVADPKRATKPTPRRVKSALESRRQQESSDIFPEPSSRTKRDPRWGVTQYSLDYGPKKAEPPARLRPSSPTRMNNPHPSRPFLVWKQPVRVHLHKKAVQPQADSWRFIHEGFYDDYTDTLNTGDAKNEVPITNLAKIEFPGGKRKQFGSISTPHMVNRITGTKALLNDRHTPQSHTGSHRSIRPASPQSRILHNTLKGNTLPVFKDWLQMAPSKERDVVIQMLKAAQDQNKERRLQKAVTEVLQPDSAKRAQDWIKQSTPEEQQMLLGILETLAVAADEINPELPYSYRHQIFGLRGRQRANSYPVTLRQRSHRGPSHYSGSHAYSRHSHDPYHSKRHATDQKHRSSRMTETGAGENQTMNFTGMTIKPQAISHKLTTPELWHHRIKKKTLGMDVINVGGVWSQPKKDRGQHYSIHPEWPTA